MKKLLLAAAVVGIAIYAYPTIPGDIGARFKPLLDNAVSFAKEIFPRTMANDCHTDIIEAGGWNPDDSKELRRIIESNDIGTPSRECDHLKRILDTPPEYLAGLIAAGPKEIRNFENPERYSVDVLRNVAVIHFIGNAHISFDERNDMTKYIRDLRDLCESVRETEKKLQYHTDKLNGGGNSAEDIENIQSWIDFVNDDRSGYIAKFNYLSARKYEHRLLPFEYENLPYRIEKTSYDGRETQCSLW